MGVRDGIGLSVKTAPGGVKVAGTGGIGVAEGVFVNGTGGVLVASGCGPGTNWTASIPAQ